MRRVRAPRFHILWYNQFIGIVPHLVEGGLSILQYADDTILFMEDDLEKAKNMKDYVLSRSYWVSKSTFIKVNWFVLGRQRKREMTMWNCLGVKKAICLSNIWAYQ